MEDHIATGMRDGTSETSLSHNTPIYRIINFFELYDLLSQQHFRVSKAAMFVDENETIDEILHSLQALAGPCRGGVGYNWEGKYHDAVRSHNETKHSAFISSWSTKSDSVAMWSLYSNDFLGVRIKTTVGKLLETVSLYQAKNSPIRLCKPGTAFTCAVGECYIERVSYVDVKKMLSRIIRRKKAYNKIEPTLKARGIEPYQASSRTKRYINFLKLPEQFYLLKDDSFTHEDEVRAVIRVGRINHAEDDILTPERIINAVGEIAKFQHKILGKALPEDFENNIFLKISRDFIEEIAIDPRCPDFKKNQMLSIIKKLNINIAESKSFGYLPKAYHFIKTFDGEY